MKCYKYIVIAIPNTTKHIRYNLGSYNKPVVDKDVAISAAKKFQTRLKDCDVIVEKRVYVDDVVVGFEIVFNAREHNHGNSDLWF
jgi:hypothetical protein